MNHIEQSLRAFIPPYHRDEMWTCQGTNAQLRQHVIHSLLQFACHKKVFFWQTKVFAFNNHGLHPVDVFRLHNKLQVRMHCIDPASNCQSLAMDTESKKNDTEKQEHTTPSLCRKTIAYRTVFTYIYIYDMYLLACHMFCAGFCWAHLKNLQNFNFIKWHNHLKSKNTSTPGPLEA